MIKLAIFAAFVVGLESAKLAPISTYVTACSRSRDCPPGSGLCCRDCDNKLLDPHTWGRPGGQDLLRAVGNGKTGTCKPIKGRRGEVCSAGCQCGLGLLCYRPPTGVCCPPSTCEPEKYVIEQREYWRNCGTKKNPKCRLPPSAPPRG